MPIKGVSELRRLPRLGKIRLGVRRPSDETGSLYPKAQDFFVVPEDIKRFLGDTPRSLDIVFPIEDKSKSVDEQPFFPQWLKSWGSGSGLKCKGNGEKAHRVQKGGGFVEVECDPESCPEFQAKPYPQCARNANLQFMIPGIPGAGIWQIDTGSFHSILQVNSALELIRSVAGRLSLIPLRLILEPKEVAPDGKKKIVFILNLRYDGTVRDLAAIAGRASSSMFALPPVDDSLPPDDIVNPDIVATYRPALDAREAEEAELRREAVAAQSPLPFPPPTPTPSPARRPGTPPPDPATMSDKQVEASIVAGFLKLGWNADQQAIVRRERTDPRRLLAYLREKYAEEKADEKGGGQGDQGRLVE